MGELYRARDTRLDHGGSKNSPDGDRTDARLRVVSARNQRLISAGQFSTRVTGAIFSFSVGTFTRKRWPSREGL